MDEVLTALCDLLDEELGRQTKLLEASQELRGAVASQIPASVEEKTAALNVLIKQNKVAEGERCRLLYRIVEHFGLETDEQTLTDLIKVAPEPWSLRLRKFQTQCNDTLKSTKAVTRQNTGILRKSLRVIDRTMYQILSQNIAETGGYDSSGGDRAKSQLRPAMIDQAG